MTSMNAVAEHNHILDSAILETENEIRGLSESLQSYRNKIDHLNMQILFRSESREKNINLGQMLQSIKGDVQFTFSQAHRLSYVLHSKPGFSECMFSQDEKLCIRKFNGCWYLVKVEGIDPIGILTTDCPDNYPFHTFPAEILRSEDKFDLIMQYKIQLLKDHLAELSVESHQDAD